MPNSSTSALCSVPCVTGDGHTATLTLSPTRRPSADFKLQIFRDRDHVSHTLYLTDRQAWEFFRAALCAVAQTGPLKEPTS